MSNNEEIEEKLKKLCISSLVLTNSSDKKVLTQVWITFKKFKLKLD